MTRSLPRPSSEVAGSRASVRTRRAPRSSNGLWTTANRSAGPPTRIVVNRPSGSSREVLTPIRRWMSRPDRERRRTAGRAAATVAPVTRAPPRGRLDLGRRRAATRAARPRARGRRRRRRRRAGRGRARRRTSPAWRAGSASSPATSTSRSASRSSSSTRIAAPASANASALRRWWPAAWGYGTIAVGSANAAASASVEAPARPTARSAAASASVMSSWRNGIRPVAVAEARRAAPRAPRPRRRTPSSPVTWTTRTRSTSRGSAASTASLIRRTACDPPNTSRIRSPAGRRRRARLVDVDPVSERIGRPGRRTRAGAPEGRGASRRGSRRARSARRATNRTDRPGTTLPSHSTLGMRSTDAASSVGIAT